MRYVVVITAIAFFLIYDGLYNDGHYLAIFLRWLTGVLRMIGVS